MEPPAGLSGGGGRGDSLHRQLSPSDLPGQPTSVGTTLSAATDFQTERLSDVWKETDKRFQLLLEKGGEKNVIVNPVSNEI